MFEKEINKGNMTVDDLFQAIEAGDYDRPPNSESSSESFQPEPNTSSLEQEPNNRSLHVSDLEVKRSSSINSLNSPLYTPESADDESSNGRLRVSDLIEEESLYTPDSGSKSSRNGGKKRGTMRRRGKKRKSSRKRKRS
jgi:hypothetical protein